MQGQCFQSSHTITWMWCVGVFAASEACLLLKGFGKKEPHPGDCQLSAIMFPTEDVQCACCLDGLISYLCGCCYSNAGNMPSISEADVALFCPGTLLTLQQLGQSTVNEPHST
jgi:hypothetical protein